MSGWLWSDKGTQKAESRDRKRQEAHSNAFQQLLALMQSEDGHRAAQQLVQGGELNCPEDITSERFLKKWLVAREWNVQHTYSSMIDHAHWRSQTMPSGYIDEAWIQQPLADEKTYLQGCDNKGRAFAIIQAAKHLTKKSDIHQMKLFTCYTVDAMSALCDADRNPGRRVVCMFDLTRCGLANLDMSCLHMILCLLSEHYVEQLDAMWFYNPPVIFWGLWNAIKGLVPEVTRSKIKFIDPGDLIELREAVHADVLPKDYGGKAELLLVNQAVRKFKLPPFPHLPDVAGSAGGAPPTDIAAADCAAEIADCADLRSSKGVMHAAAAQQVGIAEVTA